MSVTIGEINGRVFVELDMLADYFSADDVHRAVVQRLNVRTEFTRSADTNRLLSTTAEFTPTDLLYDITSEIGLGSAAWIECKNTGNDRFYPIRIVGLVELEEYTKMGILAAAFWSEDPSHGSEPAAVQYVQFSYLPPSVCRIRFDRDIVRKTVAGLSLLPDHVADLISKEAQMILIPPAKARMAMDLRRNEALRQDFKAIVAMVDGLLPNLALQIKDLIRLWEIWSFRTVNVPFNNPTPSGRGMYGDTTFDRF